MIAYLEGTILHKEPEHVVLLRNGLGYKIFVTNDLLGNCAADEPKKLWIHHHIREQASDLYGFETRMNMDFFNLLLGVNGIGPKSALGVMNTAPTEVLVQSIGHNDLTHLTKVAGIGKKSAEKILLELRDKVSKINLDNAPYSSGASDALEALVSLGYSEKEARTTIQSLDPNLTTEEMVTKALQTLH